MAWSGGVFNRLYNWQDDAAADILILADRMDGEFDNYKGGLQNCITRDNQTPPTANISFGGFKITSLANGTAATDAATIGQITEAGAIAVGENFLDNGGMEVRGDTNGGRGTNVAAGSGDVLICDRWWGSGSGATCHVGPNPTTGGGMPNLFRLGRDAASVSVTPLVLGQHTGAVLSLGLANYLSGFMFPSVGGFTPSSLIFSLYGYRGADFSGANITMDILSNSSDQNILVAGSWFLEQSEVIPFADTGLTYMRHTAVKTGALNASANILGVRVRYTPSGTAGADDNFYITGLKLEINTTGLATAYIVPTQGEALARCQRFYQVMGEAAAGFRATGNAAGAYDHDINCPFPIQMVKTPVATVGGTWLNTNCATPTVPLVTSKNFVLRSAITGAGVFVITPNVNGFVSFSAET